MYVNLFWLIAIACIIVYWRWQDRKARESAAKILESTINAAIESSKDDHFALNYCFWLDELPRNKDTGNYIRRIYALYNLAPPDDLVVSRELQDKMRIAFRRDKEQLSDYRRQRQAHYESFDNY